MSSSWGRKPSWSPTPPRSRPNNASFTYAWRWIYTIRTLGGDHASTAVPSDGERDSAGGSVAAPSSDKVIPHSDRGSQFRRDDYQNYLPTNDKICSINEACHCGDNAACEGFFRLLKRERIYRNPTLDATPSECVCLHGATPQSKDAAKICQARSKGCKFFTTVRDLGVDPDPAASEMAPPDPGSHNGNY